MRRLIQVSLVACAVLLVPACNKYLPNAPEELPEAAPPLEDRGLAVRITSDQAQVSQEGEVTFTVTTTGGNGQYRYGWTLVDCFEAPSGREQCDWHYVQTVEGGATLSFTRYRRASDTRMTINMRVNEWGGVKYGEAVHHLLGPNDRAD